MRSKPTFKQSDSRPKGLKVEPKIKIKIKIR